MVRPRTGPRSLPFQLMTPSSPASGYTQCPIIHQDARFIVVHKPPGILSHPNATGPAERAAFQGRFDADRKSFSTPAGTVWLVHRLDQDTSGVLVGTLDAEAAAHCRLSFEQGRVKKTYLALLFGSPQSSGTWKDALLTQREKGRVRTVVQRGARPNAELAYRVIAHNRTQRLSLVEIDLITGRTHQIRVQAASRHTPVVGDDVYGDFTQNKSFRKATGIRRLCLHARRLSLPHPDTGKVLTLHAPEPPEWTSMIGN